MPELKLPGINDRTIVIGRTGSGKTQFGAFVLSEAAFNKIPFVMIDYKGDALLKSIPRVTEIGLNEVPKQPGLYHVRPRPEVDDDAVETFLWNIWKREKVGLFVDEVYRMPERRGSFNAVLTQGRSKKIPVIACSQRPAWVSRFVFSEADFFALFHLTDKDDRTKVRRFISAEYGKTLNERLSSYWSHWYDVKQDALWRLQPAPSQDEILDRFDARLTPKRRFF